MPATISVNFASQAEAIAGTLTNKSINPVGLKAALDSGGGGSGYVTIARAQTITGAKTFSVLIGGSISGNAATVTNGVYTIGNQTIAGVKTFSSLIGGSIDGNAETATNASNGVPIGAVMPFAMNSNPSGWLFCNGAPLNRTLYRSLYDVIGYTYGGSDATFNLPDIRGIFIRGINSQNIGGQVFSGNTTFGARMGDAIQEHNHTGTTNSRGNHSHQIKGQDNSAAPRGTASNEVANVETPGSGLDFFTRFTSFTGAHEHSLLIDNRGSEETRPANITLRYCIKWRI